MSVDLKPALPTQKEFFTHKKTTIFSFVILDVLHEQYFIYFLTYNKEGIERKDIFPCLKGLTSG